MTRALIAEDEPLLADALQQELARAWPGLQIAARVGDGLSAVREALALAPEVLFFDIRMHEVAPLLAAAEKRRAAGMARLARGPHVESLAGPGERHADLDAKLPA